ncbi:hypothetical protein DL96DRAFT_1685149 [Flagelloscypha sp. PMI_526]|nr:hypothetical protein DL96DRAFT_1685149 [Flagelloscypha sp. PMI_526]
MALPPPRNFRANLYPSLILYADPHDDNNAQPVSYLPPSKGGILSSVLKRFHSAGREKSLEWLEKTCRTAKSRSAMWSKEDLVDIQTRSGDHEAYTRRYSVAGAEEVQVLHSRAAAAARTLLSLPEAPLPILPQELVHCIFLWVARRSVAEAKNLSLVSTTVQNWADPFVFKYLRQTQGIEEITSSRLLRAKAHYFIGYDALPWSIEIASLCRQLPMLRSIPYSLRVFTRIPALPPSICRLHIDYYATRDMPLSFNVFSKITHLSLNMASESSFSNGWEPLKDLIGLRCFVFQSQHVPRQMLWPNEAHAKLWIDFAVSVLFPCMPTSVELVLGVLPDICINTSLESYRMLFDGTVDRRLLIAFQKGDGSGTHATSESAGAGSYAFVYPVFKHYRSTGLDWLEWLWEEALMFLKNRERTSKVDAV